MSAPTIYSFLDCVLTLAFASGGMTITGEGIGEFSIDMDTDRTAQEVASDGNVMISKIAGNNGTLKIDVLQTSLAHKFLLACYNFNIVGPPSIWASGVGLARCISDGTSNSFTGISFTKLPSQKRGKQGGLYSWDLKCADIQSMPF